MEGFLLSGGPTEYMVEMFEVHHQGSGSVRQLQLAGCSGPETNYHYFKENVDLSEVYSTAQNFVHFSEAEEDLVFRMHRLVGNRWELIAGRIPGRTAKEIEMFWAIKNQDKSEQKNM
ncbi:hypothetical protein ABZP36_015717 [Zizania latifolia]